MADWVSYYRGDGPDEEEDGEQQEEEGPEAVGKMPSPRPRAARGCRPSAGSPAADAAAFPPLRSGLQVLGAGQLDFLGRRLQGHVRALRE